MEKTKALRDTKNHTYLKKIKIGKSNFRKNRSDLSDTQLFDVDGMVDYMTFEKKKTTYISKERIKAKVLEISNEKFILKCLINENEKIFQKRIFDKEPFQGLNINENDYIDIEIQTKTGERKFIYKRSIIEYSDIFDEKEDFFKGLDNIDFFKPLSADENNL